MSPRATAAGPPAAADAAEGPSSPQPQVLDLLTAGASNHLQATHTVWVRAVTDVEAVELAKALSTDDSPGYVNGVLGGIVRAEIPT